MKHQPRRWAALIGVVVSIGPLALTGCTPETKADMPSSVSEQYAQLHGAASPSPESTLASPGILPVFENMAPNFRAVDQKGGSLSRSITLTKPYYKLQMACVGTGNITVHLGGEQFSGPCSTSSPVSISSSSGPADSSGKPVPLSVQADTGTIWSIAIDESETVPR